MTISTYDELLDEIGDYLARDDLDSKFPTFVKLTEAKLNRELFVRQMEQRSTSVIDSGSEEPEFISLPTDFQSMRSIRLSSVTGKPSLEYVTQVELNTLRTKYANAPGQPQYFSVIGEELELFPTPDDDYTIEMIYRKNIPSLVSNSTNWLLTLAPDVYLYGALLEAAPYTKQDTRIQVWGLGYTTALDGLNRLGLMSTFNAGPLTVRPWGPTP